MARRKDAGHGGGHGWFVTFADLMGLLVAFFVMLVAASTQDREKLQLIAGSMREAFGVQTAVRYSGVVEIDGMPMRPRPKNTTQKEDSKASASPESSAQNRHKGVTAEQDRAFALAAASLRQSLQSLPDLTELSSQVMFEQTEDGLNIEIVDHDGRPLFPDDPTIAANRRITITLMRGASPLPPGFNP